MLDHCSQGVRYHAVFALDVHERVSLTLLPLSDACSHTSLDCGFLMVMGNDSLSWDCPMSCPVKFDDTGQDIRHVLKKTQNP